MTNIVKLLNDWAILGRPGYAGKKKQLRRAEIQKKFGEGNWKIAHLVEDKILTREEALFHFEESYFSYFKKNPAILEWLIYTASDIYDTAPSNIDSGLDYSKQETSSAHLHDIAIRRVINRLERKFSGDRLLQIRGEESEGSILTTGEVPFYKPSLILKPQLKGWWKKDSIESFWQSNKVLAVKFNILENMSEDIVGVILRKDIHMGKGKFSTQAAHAIVSLIPERGLKWNFNKAPIEVWTVNGEDTLLGIHSKIRKMKINCSLIRDAGKTQLTPGTYTAVGIGPIKQALFDKVMFEFEGLPLESIERSYCNFSTIKLNKF
ncbi:MAG: hypothetical protein EAX90_03405 [Candidatus Heimdallarchaeota archaeon]|nr:hypothetical protein [Candidatus Heimdallarchaeota archaeon]